MTGIRKNIKQVSGMKSGSLIRSASVLCCTLLFFCHDALWAQVISNNGAVITVTSGTVVNGGDIENTSGAVSNAGTISLTGSYTNTDTTDGNGTYDIAGNLTISAGTFDLGTGTANRASAGGVLSLNTGATLKLSGASGGVTGSNFPSNFTTVTLSGTVEFNGTGAQAIPVFTYTNLTLSNAGVKTIDASFTVQGNLTVNSGSSGTVNVSVVLQIDGNIDLTGSITNNGTINVGN